MSHRRCRRWVLLLAVSLPLPVLAGALVSEPAVAAGARASVASAGSLQELLDGYVGVDFQRRTRFQYQNRSQASLALAQEIRSEEITPNVFISIGAAPMRLLEPKFTTWAVRLAAGSLVVAYNPKGRYASELRKIARHQLPIRDLFQLMARPGFRLGRTDPAIDPQGQSFLMMFQLARRYLGVSAKTVRADLGGADQDAQIFSETALEPTLQAGQLDAASAFLPQAVQLGLPYITLPPRLDFANPRYQKTYGSVRLSLPGGKSVRGSLLDLEATVISRDGQGAAARAFVSFLLSRPIRRLMSHQGYLLLRPAVLGRRSAVPRSVLRALGG